MCKLRARCGPERRSAVGGGEIVALCCAATYVRHDLGSLSPWRLALGNLPSLSFH